MKLHSKLSFLLILAAGSCLLYSADDSCIFNHTGEFWGDIGEFTWTMHVNFTSTDTNWNWGVDSAVLKCNDTDSGKSVKINKHPEDLFGADPKLGYASRNDCVFPVVTDTKTYRPSASIDRSGKTCGFVVYDFPKNLPTCVITSRPNYYIGPFTTSVEISTKNVPEGAELKFYCSDGDPGQTLKLDIASKAYATCDYPHVKTDQSYRARVEGNVSTLDYTCEKMVNVRSPPAPRCYMGANPEYGTGPFNSDIYFCARNLPPTSYLSDTIKVLMRCSDSDAGTLVDLTRLDADQSAGIPLYCYDPYAPWYDDGTWPRRLCPGPECSTWGYAKVTCSYPALSSGDPPQTFTTRGNTSFAETDYYVYTNCSSSYNVKDYAPGGPFCGLSTNQTCSYGDANVFVNASMFRLPDTVDENLVKVFISCNTTDVGKLYAKIDGIKFEAYSESGSNYKKAWFEKVCEYAPSLTMDKTETVNISWQYPTGQTCNRTWWVMFRKIPTSYCIYYSDPYGGTGPFSLNVPGNNNIYTNLTINITNLEKKYAGKLLEVMMSCNETDSETFNANGGTAAKKDPFCPGLERFVLDTFQIPKKSVCNYPDLGEVTWDQFQSAKKTYHSFANASGEAPSPFDFSLTCMATIYDYPRIKINPFCSFYTNASIFSGEYNPEIKYCMYNIPNSEKGNPPQVVLKCNGTDPGLGVALTEDTGSICGGSTQGGTWKGYAKRACPYPQLIPTGGNKKYNASGNATLQGTEYFCRQELTNKPVTCKSMISYPNYGTSSYNTTISVLLNDEAYLSESAYLNISCSDADPDGMVYRVKGRNYFMRNCYAEAPMAGMNVYVPRTYINFSNAWYSGCSGSGIYRVEKKGTVLVYKWIGNSGLNDWDDENDSNYYITYETTGCPVASWSADILKTSANYNRNASCYGNYSGGYYNNSIVCAFMPPPPKYAYRLHRYFAGVSMVGGGTVMPQKFVWKDPFEWLRCVLRSNSTTPRPFYVNIRIETYLENMSRANIALAIDSTSSMTSWPNPSKLDYAKLGSQKFIDLTDPANYLAIVPFKTCNASVLWGLSMLDNRKDEVKLKIGNITSQGNTNITWALQVSLAAVLGTGMGGAVLVPIGPPGPVGPPSSGEQVPPLDRNITDNYKYIVLLSDGMTNCGDDPYDSDTWCETSSLLFHCQTTYWYCSPTNCPIQCPSECCQSQCMSVIDKAKKEGVVIYTIGFQPDWAGELLLQKIAEDTGGRYYRANSNNQVIQIYEEIAKNLSTKIVNVKVYDVIPTGFVDVEIPAYVNWSQGNLTYNTTMNASIPDYYPGVMSIVSCGTNMKCISFDNFNISNNKFWQARYRVMGVQSGVDIPIGTSDPPGPSYVSYQMYYANKYWPEEKQNILIPLLDISGPVEGCTITTDPSVLGSSAPLDVDVTAKINGGIVGDTYDVAIQCDGDAANHYCRDETPAGFDESVPAGEACTRQCTLSTFLAQGNKIKATIFEKGTGNALATCQIELTSCDINV